MAEADGPTFGHRLRFFLRSQRFALSILVLGIGILLTVLAAGDLTPLSHGPVFPAINQYTDQSLAPNAGPNYNLAFAILGPIISVVGAYLVGAYYIARRRFEHLMFTKSKAEFLRNIPDLEDLLWDLTPADEARYEDKKSELRVRR
ncbi:MAG: DUF3198 domain-containing protein [Thermoplasmata archaeon]|nr:DUF3198 domain-containing protein [Thermoplasmata archaeon]